MNKYRKGEVLASDTCEISQMLLTDVEWQYRYNPFGEPLKKNNYQPQWNERLDYIDKEKDRESKLGDHGVRKYDYELGRFTSVDPLWEKYTGWTGYQYSLNNPVNYLDWDGRKVTNNLTDGSEMSNLINNVYAKSETFKNMFDALNSIDYPITYKFGKLEERVLGKFIPYIDPDHSVITPGLNIPIKYESINVKKAEIIIDNSKKDSPDYNEIRTLGHETNHGHQFFLHPLIFWNYGIWSAFKNLKPEDDKLEVGGTIEGKEFEGSLIIGPQVYQEYNK